MRDVKPGINSTGGNNVHTRVVNKILQHNAKDASDTIKMLSMLQFFPVISKELHSCRVIIKVIFILTSLNPTLAHL